MYKTNKDGSLDQVKTNKAFLKNALKNITPPPPKATHQTDYNMSSMLHQYFTEIKQQNMEMRNLSHQNFTELKQENMQIKQQNMEMNQKINQLSAQMQLLLEQKGEHQALQTEDTKYDTERAPARQSPSEEIKQPSPIAT